MMEMALIENIQRQDLNPLEESEAYAILSSKYGLSHDKIAESLGKKTCYNYKFFKITKTSSRNTEKY